MSTLYKIKYIFIILSHTSYCTDVDKDGYDKDIDGPYEIEIKEQDIRNFHCYDLNKNINKKDIILYIEDLKRKEIEYLFESSECTGSGFCYYHGSKVNTYILKLETIPNLLDAFPINENIKYIIEEYLEEDDFDLDEYSASSYEW